MSMRFSYDCDACDGDGQCEFCSVEFHLRLHDYFSFLCALNYSSTEIKLTIHRDFTCDTSKKYRLGDFNYPSFAVPLETSSGRGGGIGASTTVKYTRTLTNMGTPGTYKVTITSQAPSVKISVEPQSLTFSQAYGAGQIRMLGVYMQRSWIIFASDTSLAVLSPLPGAQILQAVSTVGLEPYTGLRWLIKTMFTGKLVLFQTT
ncbi:subtilisin-like protease SBT4.2 [Malus sylvestris]|uniref:subtilisin-like protease SBT4.2 n=1 Tax=Malus sylvestris TaxID=3752 RepID=UPI0021AD1D27|nr:subtilisin-like protease SBT4.2 [Malus sylvestris]